MSGFLRELSDYPIKGSNAQTLDMVAVGAGEAFHFNWAFAFARHDSGFDVADPQLLPKQNLIVLLKERYLASFSSFFDPQLRGASASLGSRLFPDVFTGAKRESQVSLERTKTFLQLANDHSRFRGHVSASGRCNRSRVGRTPILVNGSCTFLDVIRLAGTGHIGGIIVAVWPSMLQLTVGSLCRRLRMRLVTRDLDKAVEAVTSVYCPHSVKVLESNNGIDAILETSARTQQQAISLRYSAPVQINACNFDDLLLFMTCVDGAAAARQGPHSAEWIAGSTLPLSPGLSSQLVFNRQFWQRSIRLERRFVEDVCSRLINRPLDKPLRFGLSPMAPKLEKTWQRTTALGVDIDKQEAALPPHALHRYEEMLALLVLEWHPHNFSNALERETSATVPRLVREAEHLMRTGHFDLTVSDIAATLRVSLRSLELGFREARNSTPMQIHRQIRLRAARETLLNPGLGTSVTSVAFSCGFAHLSRFSRYYRAEFGELPHMTLRRGRPIY